jgi:hypothetical protein
VRYEYNYYKTDKCFIPTFGKLEDEELQEIFTEDFEKLFKDVDYFCGIRLPEKGDFIKQLVLKECKRKSVSEEDMHTIKGVLYRELPIRYTTV